MSNLITNNNLFYASMKKTIKLNFTKRAGICFLFVQAFFLTGTYASAEDSFWWQSSIFETNVSEQQQSTSIFGTEGLPSETYYQQHMAASPMGKGILSGTEGGVPMQKGSGMDLDDEDALGRVTPVNNAYGFLILLVLCYAGIRYRARIRLIEK